MHLKKYIAIGQAMFKTVLIYRFDFMFSIIISPMTLILYYFIWESIFRNNQTGIINGYTFPDMMTYYVLSMIIGHFIWNMVGNDLSEKITYGELSQDLLKPVSIFSMFLANTIAQRLFAVIAEVIPVFIISFIIFRLKFISASATLLFFASLLLAFFLNFLISYAIGLLSFWMHKVESIQWLFSLFIRFLSGEFIPLTFFGSSLFTVSKFLPFYYLRFGIIEIFLGKTGIVDSLKFMAIQSVWIIFFYIIIKIIWHHGMKKFGATGG
ncbi:MAG: ABC-2 family transporter protein [Nanoarchaeota archaeon]|nr:ABC-2 family transporter protein [Nanoarchaeota archaeon]